MKNKRVIVTIIIFLLILTFLFPYTGDDWAWGSKIGLERLFNGFKNYNGRYIGNLIVLLLTRSRILRSIIMTSTILGILTLSLKIVNKENKTLFLIAFSLFLTIPNIIFRQAIVWTSGFTNYALSALLVLIYLYFNKDISYQEIENKSNKICFMFLLLGFISSLFVENITLYNIMISIIIIVYSYKKYKRVSNFNFSYLIGSILGAIVMFSNGAYRNVVNNTDNYRTIAKGFKGIILRIKDNYFGVIYYRLIFNNLFINLILSFLLMLLVFKFLNKKKIKDNHKKIVLITSTINICYILYSLITVINPNWFILLKYTSYFEGVFTAVYFVSIIILILITVIDKKIKNKLLFYLLIIILINLPLLFVTPIGGRCFFSSYIIFIILILELINYLVNEIVMEYVYKFSLIISITFGIYLFNIYAYISIIDSRRLNYLRKMSKTETEITLPILPYEEYTWMSNPSLGNDLKDRYKLFYNINDEVDFLCIDYEIWNEIK